MFYLKNFIFHIFFSVILFLCVLRAFITKVPIIENSVCQEMFHTAGHNKKILPSFLCAGYANGQKDSCEVSKILSKFFIYFFFLVLCVCMHKIHGVSKKDHPPFSNRLHLQQC